MVCTAAATTTTTTTAAAAAIIVSTSTNTSATTEPGDSTARATLASETSGPLVSTAPFFFWVERN
jgi:hypothetical protein